MSALTRYPRPHVAVDLVLLTLTGEGSRPDLGVIVQRPSDTTPPVLPGRFVRERRTVAQTVRELLDSKLGYTPRRDLALTMLDVYDDPERDARGWVMSLSYVSVLRAGEADLLDAARCDRLPVRGDASRGRRVTPEPLGYDHDAMVTTAVRRLRRRYERSPDPAGLLRPPYTLTQLRHVHEAVLDASLKRDTFNRRMREFLTPALDRDGQEMRTVETVGRPATLYAPAPRPRHDPASGPFPLPRREE